MSKDQRIYGKFTEDFPDHPKITILSDAAFRCLVEATLWSRRLQTDGFLARRLALAKWSLESLAELCTNDDEKPSLIEDETGWFIRDFAEHQDTKAEIVARREQAKAAGRLGGLAKAKRPAKRPAKRTVSGTVSGNVAEREEVVSSSLVTYGGRVTQVDAPDSNDADAPPQPPLTNSRTTANGAEANVSGPSCPRHPGGPDHDQACRRCEAVRKHRDGPQDQNRSNGAQAAIQAEERRIQRDAEDYQRRMAIRRCPDCDSDGYLDWSAQGGTRFTCPHDPRLYRAAHDDQRDGMQRRQEAWEIWNQEQRDQQLAHHERILSNG